MTETLDQDSLLFDLFFYNVDGIKRRFDHSHLKENMCRARDAMERGERMFRLKTPLRQLPVDQPILFSCEGVGVLYDIVGGCAKKDSECHTVCVDAMYEPSVKSLIWFSVNTTTNELGSVMVCSIASNLLHIELLAFNLRGHAERATWLRLLSILDQNNWSATIPIDPEGIGLDPSRSWSLICAGFMRHTTPGIMVRPARLSGANTPNGYLHQCGQLFASMTKKKESCSKHQQQFSLKVADTGDRPVGDHTENLSDNPVVFREPATCSD